MTDGEYILPRVKLSHNGINNVSVVDIEGVSEKQSVASVVSSARKAFKSGKTRSYDFRIKQLKNLRRFLKENEHNLLKVLDADLRKPYQESYLLEIDFVANEIDYTIKHLKDWMKPEVPEKPFLNFFDKLRIYNDPFGVVLVMGAWNYPIMLTLGPLLGAIAAGNTVIIKPSDLSIHTSNFLYDVLPDYIDKECYPVFLGGVPETTDLLKERFDYIFYTGSPQVGKIVHAAAAKYLTPCTLELGGKSPTYIDSTADIQMATKRMLWGKFINSGQTCVAPDYLLCDKEVQEQVVKCAEKCIKEFFGTNVKQSKDFGRMVNERHFIRVGNLLKHQKIAIGGNMDAQDLFIHPTILVDVKPDDDVMTEEIFGPVLPIVTVKNAREAVDFINAREKPLALYLFTRDQKVKDLFLNETSSGGVSVNDTIMHVAVESLPFGGVGTSGMGNYHGKKSFDIFVHKKSVLIKGYSSLVEKAFEPRYPPYSPKNTKFLRFAMKTLNFHLNLKYVGYAFIFGLGVASAVGGMYIKKQYEKEG